MYKVKDVSIVWVIVFKWRHEAPDAMQHHHLVFRSQYCYPREGVWLILDDSDVVFWRVFVLLQHDGIEEVFHLVAHLNHVTAHAKHDASLGEVAFHFVFVSFIVFILEVDLFLVQLVLPVLPDPAVLSLHWSSFLPQSSSWLLGASIAPFKTADAWV